MRAVDRLVYGRFLFFFAAFYLNSLIAISLRRLFLTFEMSMSKVSLDSDWFNTGRRAPKLLSLRFQVTFLE